MDREKRKRAKYNEISRITYREHNNNSIKTDEMKWTKR